MKLNKFAYSNPLRNHTLKRMEKYLEIYFKNLEKSWKYHGILSVQKSGNPVIFSSSAFHFVSALKGFSFVSYDQSCKVTRRMAAVRKACKLARVIFTPAERV